jgi:hypothetical protein
MALREAGEVHPASLVIFQVKVPGGRSVSVAPAPVPGVSTAPGVLVAVQEPVAGKPVRMMLPVATAQVGWVMVPRTGAFGVAGWALITTLVEALEAHPVPTFTV